MKKKLLSLALILMLIMSLFVFTACGSDDEDENDDEEIVENYDEDEEEDDDDYVTNTSKSTADETTKATVQSALGMAISGIQTTWYNDYYVENSTTDDFSDYLTKSNLNNWLDSDYEVTYLSSLKNDEMTGTITYNDEEYDFTLTLTSSGNGATVSLND